MLEQNTVSLDKQSAGIQRMVTEVVKKQEENTSVRNSQFTLGTLTLFKLGTLGNYNFKKLKL